MEPSIERVLNRQLESQPQEQRARLVGGSQSGEGSAGTEQNKKQKNMTKKPCRVESFFSPDVLEQPGQLWGCLCKGRLILEIFYGLASYNNNNNLSGCLYLRQEAKSVLGDGSVCKNAAVQA